MIIIRVSRQYRFMPEKDLGSFSSNVLLNLSDHMMQFPMLPVPIPSMTIIITDFASRRDLYKNGGINQKGAYLVAKDALINMLDQTAVYVDSVAQGEEAIILNSGFKPTKGSRTPSPKPTVPQSVSLSNVGIQSLEAQCNVQPAVSTYMCILTEGAPLPAGIHITNSGQMDFGIDGADDPEARAAMLTALSKVTNAWMDLTKSRIKRFAGLTPTKRYFVTFCAINPTGVGPLSPAVSTVCL